MGIDFHSNRYGPKHEYDFYAHYFGQRSALRRTIWQKAPVKKKIAHFLVIFVQNGCATTLFPSLSSRRHGASLAEGRQNGFIEDSDVRIWSLFVLGFLHVL